MGKFLVGLGLKYLWYIVGFAAILAVVGGAYLYVYNKGKNERDSEILRQTARIVQQRKKTDEKVNSLADDALRSELRRWVLRDPG